MKLALVRPSDNREEGLLDSDLALFLGISTRQLNQAAERSIHVARRGNLRYQMGETEWRSFRSERENGTGRGGRRYRPYVYTFEGMCLVIARLRLDLSDTKKRSLLRLFGKAGFPITDYGQHRHEETIIRFLSKAFRGVLTVRRHFPVKTESGRFSVDAYLVEAKVAIEVDERDHRSRPEYDRQRQMLIEKALSCRFLRVREDADPADVINKILKSIAPCDRPKTCPTEGRHETRIAGENHGRAEDTVE